MNKWNNNEFNKTYLNWRKNNKPNRKDIKEMTKERLLKYCDEINESLIESAKCGLLYGETEILVTHFGEDEIKDKVLPFIKEYFQDALVEVEKSAGGNFLITVHVSEP